MGFYTGGKRGTITRPRFNARGACKRLYEGMKGFGTNEDAIIEVVAGHTVSQRQEIKSKYKIMYGKDLIKELDGELSGAFLKIVLALMKDPEEYILECLRSSIVKSRGDKLLKKMKKAYKKGLCTDAYTLLGILCLQTNEQLEEMKKAYKLKYDTQLEDDLGQDFPDEFRSIIFGIICAARDESADIDFELVDEDIENLQTPSEGTKEEYFQSIYEDRSWAHLRKLFNSYKDVAGEPMESLIEKSEVYTDVMKEAYISIIKIIRSEPDFYAERLKEAIDGIGTDDETLIRFIVLRAEIDLVDVIMRYEVLFGTSLEDDVVGDTSGDYKNILLKLLTLPEEDEEEDECCITVVKKKVAGVEIMTQTDLVEHEEEVSQEVQNEGNYVNLADENVEEAIGHEVEEEVIQAKVEKKKESAPPPADEEEEEEEETKVAAEEAKVTAEEAIEDQIEEVKEEAVEEQIEVEEAKEEDEPKEKEEEEEVAEVPTIEQVEEETTEEKKNEDADNADGG